MKKVELIGNTTSGWTGHRFSLLEKIGPDTYKSLLPFIGCRSYMCDTLFNHKNPTYATKPSYPFEYDYKKGSIFVGVQFSDKKQKKTFFKNLHILHAKETQAKVKKSIVYETQEELFVVVEGSKYWKDSCWKMMLYTFYIKTIGYENPKDCDTSYWKALDGKEDQLLSKLKIQREIFHPSVYGEDNSYGRHSREGFVAICSGSNPPMAKLLGVA